MIDNHPSEPPDRGARIVRHRRRALWLQRLPFLFLLASLTVAADFHPAAESLQGPSPWTTPQRIPDYFDLLSAPLLAADATGTIHAFDMESPRTQEFAIMHRTWTERDGWSAPTDVLLAPFLGAAPRLEDVFIDQEDVLHLIFASGDLAGGQIIYTQAPVGEASEARRWSEPVELKTDLAPEGPASLTGDGAGRMTILYGGNRFGDGVYEIQSVDGGQVWTEPRLISRTRAAGDRPVAIWSETDDKRRVHVAWATANDRGAGQDIRYVRLDADDRITIGETEIAARDDVLDNLGWPSLVTLGDRVIVVYQDDFPATRWFRQSEDAGATWSEPIRPFPHVGGYGFTALVKDSRQTVHMILGNRLPDPEIHGMWYSRLEQGQWLPLAPIISGPATDSFDPCCPSAVVSRGNLLMATWPHNVRQENLTGAWYSTTRLNAAELPPPAPRVAISPTETSPAASVIESPVASLPPATQTTGGSARPGTSNPLTPILLGVAPVVLLIAVIARWRQARVRSADSPPAAEPPPPSTDVPE